MQAVEGRIGVGEEQVFDRVRDEDRILQKRSWSNWLLMVVVLLASITVLALAGLSLPSSPARWPWPHTDVVLVAGLLAANVSFAIYVTVGQRQVIRLRRQLYGRLLSILGLIRGMGAGTEQQAVLDSITRICHESFPSDQVSLMLLDPATASLKVASARGHLDPAAVLGREQCLGHGIAGRVAETREGLLLGPSIHAHRFLAHRESPYVISSSVVVPVLVRQEVVGVLSISSRSPRTRYGKLDLQALEIFAEYAGVCIRHAEQRAWMLQRIDRLEHEVERRPA